MPDVIAGKSGAAPTEPPAAQPAHRRGGSRDPKVFVLLRELSEVHLLLDHVSANSTTTVAEVTKGTMPQELPKNWIEKVCEISWPPDGSNEEKATDAALLIRAKDYLNRLSHPASGATIAFTLLVTQQDGQERRRWRVKRSDDKQPAASPTRSSLAQTAYPDLVGKAAGFRRWMMGIGIGLVLALLVTCGLSWYVAEGNSALAELQAARAAVAEIQGRINEAEASETPPTPDAPEPAAAAAQPFVGLCERLPYSSAIQAQLCRARELAEADLMRAEERLKGWDCRRPFTDCTGAKASDAPSRAAAFVNIVGSAVLPFLYGLLGAGAAIVRSLSRKIRSSRLSPRDLHLSFQQLALGAVVGACIGLFVAAPGSDATGESLLGPVALSASAISFVAGFGVEAVFQALEALIARIFNVAPPATANRGDGLPSS